MRAAFAIGSALLALGPVGAAEAASQRLPAASFVAASLTDPSLADAVRREGTLRPSRCCVVGTLEYAVELPRAGWYTVSALGGGHLVELTVSSPGGTPSRFLGGPVSHAGRARLATLRLAAGPHRLQLAYRRWNGFPEIRAIEVAPSDPLDDLANVTIDPVPHWGAFEVGRCPEIPLRSGPRARPALLEVRHVDAESGRVVQRGSATLPAGSGEDGETGAVRPYCATPGFYRIEFGREGVPADRASHPQIEYEVVDGAVAARAPSADRVAVVADFACAERAPEHSDGSDRVREAVDGRYRTSGPRGWLALARTPAAARAAAPAPNWFAYTIDGLRAGEPHRVTVSFPDDATRSFVVVAKTDTHLGYRPGVGIETGGEFPLGGRTASRSWTWWPLAGTARLWLAPYHDGAGAACSRIRVERLEGGARAVAATGGRRVLHWYEEGAGFRAVFGAADEGFVASSRAIDRWLDTAAANGFDTVVPTASVYDQSLYPSRFNTAFSVPGLDLLGRVMIGAHARGIAVVPELHPRGDDLLAGLSAVEAEGLLLRRFDGTSNRVDAARRPNAPPHFDALEPRVADWYVGAILELATRYRDAPAFAGVSLRHMGWANGAFNNLVDADWGYGDASVARFLESIGRADAARGPGADPVLREALRRGALRDAWIEWRCRRIEDLYRRIVAEVRRVRPDLVVYLNVWGGGDDPGGAAAARRLREAGVDLERLAMIDGIRIVVSAQPYGRRETAPRAEGTYDWLRATAASGETSALRRGGALLAGHRYLELPGELDRPEAVGLHPGPRAAWVSVASNAAGDAAAERFAALLADRDPVALGDGGNAYVFDVEPVARLLRRFRTLPAVPFDAVGADGDAVVARTARVAGRRWLYLVNATPFAMRVRIDGAAALAPPDGDGPATTRLGDAVAMRMRPFELAVLVGVPGDADRAPGPVRIEPDPKDLARLRADAGALRELARAAGPSSRAPAEGLLAVAGAVERELDGGRVRGAWARLHVSGTWRALARVGCTETAEAAGSAAGAAGAASAACEQLAGRSPR